MLARYLFGGAMPGATVRWTADQMLRKLLPEGGEPLWRDPTGKIVLAEMGFTPAWIGEQVKSLEASTTSRIAFVDRLGQAFVPEPGTVLQEGDVLHIVARESDLDRIAGTFSRPAHKLAILSDAAKYDASCASSAAASWPNPSASSPSRPPSSGCWPRWWGSTP